MNDTESLPFPSFRSGQKRESKGNDAERRAQYRELIMENISYDVLLVDLPYDKEIIEEILELIVDHSSARSAIILASLTASAS